MFLLLSQLIFAVHSSLSSIFNGLTQFSSSINDGSNTIYVNSANSNPGDGRSWQTAFTTLTSALDVVTDMENIWIAEGYYYPSDSNDRSETFLVEHRIGVFGGFAGTENDINQRPNPLLPTVLSGDIGTPDDLTDNSYHILTLTINEVTIDGLIIENGYAIDDTSDITCDHCFGAGVYMPQWSANEIEKSRFTFSQVTIRHNTAIQGAGMFAIANPVITITESSLYDNSAIDGKYHSGMGGAMYVAYNGVLLLSGSSFEYNTAIGAGGAIVLDYGATSTISSTTFTSNSVSLGNGGAISVFDRDSQMREGTTVHIDNCTFNSNYAESGYAGAVWLYDGPVGTITNSLFKYNKASYGGAIGLYDVTCTNCCETFNNKNLCTNIFIDNSASINMNDCLQDTFPRVHFGRTVYIPLYYLQELYLQRTKTNYSPPNPATKTIYVNGNVISSSDCLSWNSACKTIQEALDIAEYYDLLGITAEVWVVGGSNLIYYPTKVPLWYNKTAGYYNSEKSKLIEIHKNIALFGGFDGTETSRIDRNWYNNPTFISGQVTSLDKAYQVLYPKDNTWIDGFLITDGYALVELGPGDTDNNNKQFEKTQFITNNEIIESNANKMTISVVNGLKNHMSNMVDTIESTVKNSIDWLSYSDVSNDPNHVESTNPNDVLYSKDPTKGGGIFANATTTIVNSVIYDNFGMKAGGLYVLGNDIEDHTVTVINVAFIGNGASIRGGGVSIDLYGFLDCQYCLFQNNVCRFKGGAVYSDFDAYSSFENCKFYNNTAFDSGGCIALDGAGNSILKSVEMTNNYAFSEGAGIYAGSYDPFSYKANYYSLTDVTFADNYCPSGLDDYFMWVYDYVEQE